MRVGIDIDGFLTDIASFQINQGKKYFGNIVNRNGYSIREIYNCSKKDEIKFWIRNYKYYFENPRPYAKEFIDYIRENGGKVYIITSRAYTSKNNVLGLFMRSNVKRWLSKNHIKYDDIAFCDEDKMKAVKKFNIDIMGEDKPENINEISKVAKIICMQAPYNQEVINDNMYRINDFNEGIEIYSKLSKKNES